MDQKRSVSLLQALDADALGRVLQALLAEDRYLESATQFLCVSRAVSSMRDAFNELLVHLKGSFSTACVGLSAWETSIRGRTDLKASRRMASAASGDDPCAYLIAAARIMKVPLRDVAARLALNGEVQFLQGLLDYSERSGLVSDWHYFAMLFACMKNRVLSLRVLVRAHHVLGGSSLAARPLGSPFAEMTALMVACGFGAPECARVLLEAGASPGVRIGQYSYGGATRWHPAVNFMGAKAMTFACRGGHAECARILLAHDDVPSRLEAITAVEHGSTECLALLVDVKHVSLAELGMAPAEEAVGEREASYSYFCADQMGLLGTAAAYGREGCLSVLLAALPASVRAAELRRKGVDGCNAIHQAALADASGCLEMMLEPGDPAVEDPVSPVARAPYNGDLTPLMCAIFAPKRPEGKWRGASVRVLLEKRANPNAGSEERLPLHIASKEGVHDAVEALLVHGADPHAALSKYNGHTGMTALMYGAKWGHTRCCVAILRHCAARGEAGLAQRVQRSDGMTSLSLALVPATRGSDRSEHVVEAIASFATGCEDVDVPDDHGYTPLMWACQYANDYAVRVLLRHGACAGRSNASGHTPVMLVFLGSSSPATAAQRTATVGELLGTAPAARQTINARSIGGKTAVHHAVATYQCPGALSTLVKFGAEVDVEDEQGASPLAMAIEGRQRDTVRALLDAKADVSGRGDVRLGTRPPLWSAAAMGDEGMLASLLAARADPNVVWQGRSAAMAAQTSVAPNHRRRACVAMLTDA